MRGHTSQIVTHDRSPVRVPSRQFSVNFHNDYGKSVMVDTLYVHLHIGAAICTVPTAEAVATGEIDCYNCMVQLRFNPQRLSARGTIV